MSRLITVLIFVFTTTIAFADTSLLMKGTNYPPLPNGCSEMTGILLANRTDVAYAQIKCGKETYLSLSLLESMEGTAHWKIANVIKLPKLRDNWVVNDGSDCTYRSNATDSNQVLVAVSDKWRTTPAKNYAPHIFYAFLVDGIKLKFQRLDPKNLDVNILRIEIRNLFKM